MYLGFLNFMLKNLFLVILTFVLQARLIWMYLHNQTTAFVAICFRLNNLTVHLKLTQNKTPYQIDRQRR